MQPLDDKAINFMKQSKASGMSKEEAMQFLGSKGYDIGVTPQETSPTPQSEQKETWGQKAGNMALEALPILGGIGGAAGGAALGGGIGSIPGAGAGSALGETAKQGIQNLLGQRQGIDPKAIGTQAAFGTMGQGAGRLAGAGLKALAPQLGRVAGINPQSYSRVIKLAEKGKKPFNKKNPSKYMNFFKKDITEFDKPMKLSQWDLPMALGSTQSPEYLMGNMARLGLKSPGLHKALIQGYGAGSQIPMGAGLGSSLGNIINQDRQYKQNYNQ